VSLDGTITMASSELVEEVLEKDSPELKAVVLLLDTPGGSMDATFKIVESIERSRVPVIGYVFPEGAKAWSAGTYILLSTHIAAMAPHALAGSCQPVSFSPTEGSKPISDPKIINALTAFLVERAKMHNRNQTAARLFVQENLNVNSDEAKRLGVIEVLASSIGELLARVDGMSVKTAKGVETLHISGAQTVRRSPSLRVLFLKTISEPMIAFLLFTIGIYALIFGFSSPGLGGEIVGAICLILGLIGLGLTGANTSALLLMGLGAVLLIAEVLTPGFGIKGGAGLFCLVLGSLLLFPHPWMVSAQWFEFFMTAVIAVAVVLGSFFTFVIYKVAKARRMRPTQKQIVGETAQAVDEISPNKLGFVQYQGEYWKAKSDVSIKAGEKVVISRKEGPILIVHPYEKQEP